MKRFLLITSLLLSLFACKQKSTEQSADKISMESLKETRIVSGSLAHRIDSLLQKEIKIGFSGTVCVMIKDELILQNGYGWTDSLKTVPITPLTGFYLASTTKGVTGTMALLAQQNGILSIYDSLAHFDPNCPKEFSELSIHKMLIHTSGLSGGYETFGATRRDQNIELIYNLPLKEKDAFNYSGTGYWLTAALIEKQAKISYEEYVRDKLFQATNMNDTYFWFEVDEDDKTLFAQKLEKFPPNGIEPNWGFRGSSGIMTNIIDLRSYFQALIEGKLLNQEAQKQLFGPHLTLGSGIGVGYGWFTTKTPRGTTEIWSRGGEGFGHNSAIRWFRDEGVAILILTNCGQIEAGDYEANKTVSDKIERLIFEK